MHRLVRSLLYNLQDNEIDIELIRFFTGLVFYLKIFLKHNNILSLFYPGLVFFPDLDGAFPKEHVFMPPGKKPRPNFGCF